MSKGFGSNESGTHKSALDGHAGQSRQLLSEGAGGRPVLILLDEVLKYMERAAAVSVLDSTLQRQAKDFFQNLTVEVAGSKRAALVYSLTWSAREALANVTKRIEDAEQTIAREKMAARGEGPARERIREMLDGRLAGHHSPEKKPIEALRRAVRCLPAIERVENMKHQLRLSKEQLDQLKERKRTEEAAAEACFRDPYGAAWLLRVPDGELEVEKVGVKVRHLWLAPVWPR